MQISLGHRDAPENKLKSFKKVTDMERYFDEAPFETFQKRFQRNLAPHP
jgi:hypothetical protein